MEPWRGTGRTTAMLRRAVSKAEAGKRVLILVASGDRPLIDKALEWTRSVRAHIRVVQVKYASEMVRGERFDHLEIDHWAWESDPIATARAVVSIEHALACRDLRIRERR